MKSAYAQDEADFILNMGPIVVFRFGVSGGLPVEYISNNIIQFGYPPEEFETGRYDFENLIYRNDLPMVRHQFRKYAQAPGSTGFTLIYRLYTKFGSVRWIEQRTMIARDDDGRVSSFKGLFFDVTDRRKAEEKINLELDRQEVLLNLKKMGGRSFQEIVDYAREEAVRLTKSRVGYIAFPTPDELTLIMHSWSKNSIRECSVNPENRQRVYPLHRTGLWGEAIRQRRPMILNNYAASSSLKKGFPKGHVRLYRYMHVPVFDGDRIVIVAGVGNKDTDYDESDVLHLTLLMQGVWELLQRKRMNSALKAGFEELSGHYAKMQSMSEISQEFLKDASEKSISEGDIDDYLSLMEKEVLLASYKKQQEIVEEGLMLTTRMNHLVNSLYNLSIGGRYLSSASFNPIDFKALYEQITLKSIIPLRRKKISVGVNMPDAFPTVKGSQKDLELAFATLIENACRRSPPGGRILVDGEIRGGFLEVRICDSGEDLDEESLPYLFQSISFIRSGHFHAPFLEGAESGLYVAKAIISDHGGFIEGVKNPEGGLIFVVKLPVDDDRFRGVKI